MNLTQTLKDAWTFLTLSTTLDEATEALFNRSSATSLGRTYRLPTVDEALGVPAIHGAVALISGTVGTLSMQGFRAGVLMPQTPVLLMRPDPFLTPQAFYSTSAASMAKYGEIVWWIASRDTDGIPSALITVPLLELQVEDNPSDRLRPIYRWGTVTSTRWSPATPTAAFVHVKYPLGEPFALRGKGPLQLCNAASSVAVEAQAWAAQFYAEGGDPSVLIKKAGFLGVEPDANGDTEADRLRAQWVGRPHNVPRVIDDSIDSVEYRQPNTQGAQMLDARQHQNGDAARMFRIPGPLLEHGEAGSTITYQNRSELMRFFLDTCLTPLYLEPIEQAITDLLTRSTTGRFNVEGILRSDIKTRYDVHKVAIDAGIYDPAYARRKEGIDPGDVEFAPVPYSPPAAVPRTIPRAASLDVRCPNCHKLVARALGPGSELECPRCKSLVAA